MFSKRATLWTARAPAQRRAAHVRRAPLPAASAPPPRRGLRNAAASSTRSTMSSSAEIRLIRSSWSIGARRSSLAVRDGRSARAQWRRRDAFRRPRLLRSSSPARSGKLQEQLMQQLGRRDDIVSRLFQQVKEDVVAAPQNARSTNASAPMAVRRRCSAMCLALRAGRCAPSACEGIVKAQQAATVAVGRVGRTQPAPADWPIIRSDDRG